MLLFHICFLDDDARGGSVRIRQCNRYSPKRAMTRQVTISMMMMMVVVVMMLIYQVVACYVASSSFSFLVAWLSLAVVMYSLRNDDHDDGDFFRTKYPLVEVHDRCGCWSRERPLLHALMSFL